MKFGDKQFNQALFNDLGVVVIAPCMVADMFLDAPPAPAATGAATVTATVADLFMDAPQIVSAMGSSAVDAYAVTHVIDDGRPGDVKHFRELRLRVEGQSVDENLLISWVADNNAESAAVTLSLNFSGMQLKVVPLGFNARRATVKIRKPTGGLFTVHGYAVLGDRPRRG